MGWAIHTMATECFFCLPESIHEYPIFSSHQIPFISHATIIFPWHPSPAGLPETLSKPWIPGSSAEERQVGGATEGAAS